ncbi:MAG: MFS transporter [Oscillospiraceae bacterium]|nr:MFS transporter [Oscillospiraceae bacterium]
MREHRFYYGWIVVAAMWVVYFGATGAALYSTSILNPLTLSAMGIDTGLAGIAVSLCTIMQAVTSPFAGMLMAKKGVRFTIITGSIAGMTVILGMVTLRITPVLFLGLYCLFGYCVASGAILTSSTLITDWFEKDRSVAMSITVTAGAISGLVLPPVVEAIVRKYDWHYGWYTSLLMLIISVLVVIFFIRNKPEDMGLEKYGIREAKKKSATNGLDLKQTLKTYDFYLYALTSGARQMIYYAILGYLVVHVVSKGISYQTAAYMMSTIAVTGLAARLAAGFMGKMPVHPRLFHAISVAIMSISALLMYVGESPAAFFLAALCNGLGFGIGHVFQPLMLSYLFGTKNFPVINGTYYPIICIFGALGPVLTRRVCLFTGSYSSIFLYYCIFAAVCALISMFIGEPLERILKDPEPEPAADAGQESGQMS